MGWVTPGTIEAAQGEEVRTSLLVYSLWPERVQEGDSGSGEAAGVRAVTGRTRDRLNED